MTTYLTISLAIWIISSVIYIAYEYQGKKYLVVGDIFYNVAIGFIFALVWPALVFVALSKNFRLLANITIWGKRGQNIYN